MERMPRSIKVKFDKDLLLINALSVALIVAVVFVPDSPLRIIMGLPFVLFYPGYTLICALFSGNRDLDGIETTALSIALSLVVVPLIGLVLNYTPFGIRLHPLVISLFLFTLLMSILSTYRRDKLPPESRFVPYLSVKIPKWRALSMPDKLIWVGLIAFIVIAGGLMAYVASMPRVGERFTEFYVLGPGGKVENHPTNLTLGESGTVILDVVNHEYEEVAYKIVIKLDNETIGIIDGITLNNELKWEEKYTFTPYKTGEKMRLEFLLFREYLDAPYRSLHLWITVRP